jgi:mannose/cellobiose epimerase-like protein (N-acyl-D-glucosamine 2-epimerase family)
MRRREFLSLGLMAAAAGAGGNAIHSTCHAETGRPQIAVPPTLAGMTLQQLRDDYRRRLFDEYLPFWERGGIDRRHGGFICELNDDGSVASPEKYIWYQGRGIWVYSFLYNEFGGERKWLDTARHARDFMVAHLHAGGGKWYEKVRPDGTLLEGVGETVYGWLFAALGLAEYHRAAGERADLDLARQSILAALKTYDEPSYADTNTMQYTGLDIDPRGLRSQGHSMVLLNVLTGLLAHSPDEQFEKLLRTHLDLLLNKFWNPQYRIVNEYLNHDYSRAKAAECYMLSGHAVEALWMIMDAALRRGERQLVDTAAARMRHLLEMCWDYVFDGFGDGDFRVFADAKHARGPDYDIKTMWAHCDAMIGCMMAVEQGCGDWAADWYGRLRDYALRVMPVADCGVWRQAVDRQGRDIKRVGVSTKRKDNFHQARYMMLNLLSLERMLARQERAAGEKA